MLGNNPGHVSIVPGTPITWQLPPMKQNFKDDLNRGRPFVVSKNGSGHPIMDLVDFVSTSNPITATISHANTADTHKYANMTVSFKF